ncbi:MAG: hypothetical protein M3R51_08735 [Candidatus Eremiobacteraeota bacterium]|nr:hypothetical protein [Candidatus Eremiobacteraeota bacterium]
MAIAIVALIVAAFIFKIAIVASLVAALVLAGVFVYNRFRRRIGVSRVR